MGVLFPSPCFESLDPVMYTLLYMYYFYILALKKKAPNQAQKTNKF